MTQPTNEPEPLTDPGEAGQAEEGAEPQLPPDPYAQRSARDQLLGPGDDPD